MTQDQVAASSDLSLPPSVVSKVDVARLVNDLERVDNELTDAAVRARTGAAVAGQPTLSSQLSDFLTLNNLTLDDDRARTDLIARLRTLKDTVPVIHMTFATPADPESLGQLASWLRSSVHTQAVIAVGLQPALIAGVYVRTPNHVQDLSMRGKLEQSHELLVGELEALRGSNV